MRWSFLFSLMFVLSLSASALKNAKAETPEYIDWSDAKVVSRMETSKFKIDFFKLANYFQTQPNGIECGPTSGAIVLNSLRMPDRVKVEADESSLTLEEKSALNPAGTAEDKKAKPYLTKYTPRNFFTAAVNAVKTRNQMFGEKQEGRDLMGRGLALSQLAAMLEAHDLKVIKQHVDEKASEDKIREVFKSNLSNAGDYVLVNYNRPALGQKGGGHISPVGMYDEATDSFLIMDVNPNRAPWVWVSTASLVKAMRTRDDDTQAYRGYVLVSEK